MSILVVGSVAMDTIETPFGKVTNALGGSAVYSSYSASFFSTVKLVAVVGSDFPEKYKNILKERKIDLQGLQEEEGKTFHWEGFYDFDLNTAHTINTELNVFENFEPVIPDSFKNTPYVFLANIDPELQLKVLNSIKHPKLVVCDTMNFWIEKKRDALLETIKKVDIFIINEGEARELSGESNLIKAAKKIRSFGPKGLIIKKGEHGALLFSDNIFSAPAYPLESVFDPTGAGDTFAGGFIGYLAKCGDLTDASLRRAVVRGTTMASFCVENFTLDRMRMLTETEITSRCRKIKELSHFENI
ncbi:MAG: PfkB family carbohydrate kinase [bacterium]|nr:PfkB family carbohydrate kinase [bacterium]